MFSVALRRSAMMAATRRSPTVSAAFSTQAKQQAQVVEEMCYQKNWTDVRDEVKEIRSILNEPKTNQAIHIPEDTAAFERKVAENMTVLQNMLSQQANHDEIFAKAHGLKLDVKSELYHFA